MKKSRPKITSAVIPEQATSTTITFCQEGVSIQDIITTLEDKFDIQFYTGLGNTNHIVKICKKD